MWLRLSVIILCVYQLVSFAIKGRFQTSQSINFSLSSAFFRSLEIYQLIVVMRLTATTSISMKLLYVA